MRVSVIVFAAALGASPVFAACDEGRIDLRGEWGQARFSVDVADEPAERSQGLMHVEDMARGAGMLFVYDRPQYVAFWMRNTLIPLDMIFADENGIVRRVHENAVPLDETSIPGGNDIQYVLEINAGLSRQFGIAPGTEMRHPSIEAAAWVCE